MKHLVRLFALELILYDKLSGFNDYDNGAGLATITWIIQGFRNYIP